MNLQDIEKQFDDILRLAQDFTEVYNVEKNKFPYHLNVIKELHDDENSHTRILMKLLGYKDGAEYPLLKSFINRMNSYCDDNADIKILKPSITTEHCIDKGNRRIDGLIMEENKYAIIIENKIMGACDLEEQIADYVKYAKKRVVNNEKIFVVYLTKNGEKKVSDCSLTDKTKYILGNRYIPMSFQYDLIPWLEEDVLPNCKVKEKCLVTAVYQYVDYLKDMCGMLDYQKEARKKALNKILDSMEDYKTIKEKLRKVQELANTLQEELDELANTVGSKFKGITEDYFNGSIIKKFADNDKMYYSSNPYYMFYDKKWKQKGFFVHFEWFPLSYDTLFDNEKQLTLELHIEGNGKGDFIKLLYDKDKNECWQNNRRTYYSETFNISDGKSFAELNDEEQKDFLEGVYSSEKIQYLMELLNETIEQMEVI